MRSIAVNSDFDIYMDSTLNLAMVTDAAAVKQNCLLASYMLLGEYPYDTTQGVTYMTDLFQNKDVYSWEESLRANLLLVPNTVEVTGIEIVQVDDELEYTATISTTFGTVSI